MTSAAATGFRHACHKSASRVLKKWTSDSARRNANSVRSVKLGSVKCIRMSPEVCTRRFDVLSDLVGQLQRRPELLFPPDQLMKIQPHRVAVDVGVKVEDVALNRRCVVLIQRGADADVGHALERAVEALEARGADIDAAAGEELVGRI